MSSRDPVVPNIYEYLDYQTYLEDWMESQKGLWQEFSYEYFMRKAGFGSKATFYNVIYGRGYPRPDTVAAIAQAMELDPHETTYLLTLVELARARSVDERREVLKMLLEEPNFRMERRVDQEPEEALSRYFSYWYCPAIWELAHTPDFKASPEWIARILTPKITEAQAAEALSILFGLGFLQESNDGRIWAKEIRISTQMKVSHEVAYRYYQSLLHNAQQALVEISPAERHYLSGIFMVPENLMPELKLKLENLLKEISTMADEVGRRSGRVYQLGILLLPLSVDSSSMSEEEGKK